MTEVTVSIESIRVEGRHRRDLGDIKKLAASIEREGLINAIAIDPESRLLAGERRLAAFRHLGRTQIPARIVDSLPDAAGILRIERDENTERKEMLPSELASLSEALFELEKPAAREAHRRGSQRGGQAGPRQGSVPGNGALPDSEPFDARNAVATALGVGASTLGRIRQVHAVANDPGANEADRTRAQDALNEMDRTGTVKPVYERWKNGEPVALPRKMPKATGQPRRLQLQTAFDRAVGGLVKTVERIDRLTLDDRFAYNAEQIGRMVRHDLLRAQELLATAVHRIPQSTKESTK